MEEEKSAIQGLIQNLKTNPIIKEPFSNYKYFEGIKGVRSMWLEINEKMSNKDIFRIYGTKKTSYEKLIGFYNQFHEQRIKKKIKAKIIFPAEDIELAKKRKDNLTETKFAQLENDAEWGVFDDIIYIQHIIGKTPRAFLIHDKFFAETYKQVFDQIWKNAEKL